MGIDYDAVVAGLLLLFAGCWTLMPALAGGPDGAPTLSEGIVFGGGVIAFAFLHIDTGDEDYATS